MPARAAVLLVLVVAGLIGLWIWQGGDTGQAQPGATPAVAAHGYTATNAVLVQTDDQGEVQYHVTAVRIDRATPESDVELTNPTMDYVDRGDGQTAGTWQISALKGIIPAGTRQIDLAGRVLAHGQPVGKPGEIHMATEQLHVDMDQEIATSQVEVSLDWRGSRLRGHGMHADLDGEKLVLESDVHGLLVH